jgi:ATP-binding cassette, subfamily B, bacterial HlyB/CyaB
MTSIEQPPPRAGEEAMRLLRVFLQLHGLPVDAGRLAHAFVQGAPAWDEAQALQALQSLGFAATSRAGTVAALSKAVLPVLVFTQDGQMMVVAQAASGAIVFQREGASAPESLPTDDFVRLWSGRWIAAQRNMQAAQAAQAAAGSLASDAPAARFGTGWFVHTLQKYQRVLAEVLLASFFVQIFALVTPLVFQVVIDKVLTHRTLNTLDVLVIALVAISLFEVALGAMRHYLFSHTTNRVDVELGAKLFRHLLHLPMSYFESRRSGDTVARMRELENARAFMTGQALSSWLDLLFAAVFLVVMFHYSSTLTWIVIGSLPIFFGASWLLTPILRDKLENKFAMGAENQAFLVETVTSMETLKSHAVEPQWQREWEKRLADYVDAAFHAGHLANATNQFITLASKLLTVVLLWVGAKLVIDGELTVGGLIAFNMLSGRVNAPILKLASVWQEFTQMKVSIARLADIMDAQAEPAFRPERAAMPDMQGGVTFDHVHFRYAPNMPEILKDVSFVAKPGEIIGIVGISGAGKTTLMRLMQRLHTPEQGRVLIDGMDLALADTSWLRRQIGVVGQDTVLFNRSVYDNIALGNPGLGMEAVMRCAKLAGAHDFVLQLPMGYDTVVGERGSRLSGGQRARIAIARALATDPKLLLLDEATAALDYESERAIHDNMAQICEGRTVFIVAHRLPTLRLAHRILVLEEGRLVQAGPHAQLIRDAGRYASLYQAHRVLEVAT